MPEEKDGAELRLLQDPYPDGAGWREILKTFKPESIAYKLLLAHIPYVFQKEPLKFALFKKTIADAFKIQPTEVFIVGSAMSGRSLKGDDIEKTYSSESDIDVLIVSEHLFTNLVMESLDWVSEVTRGTQDAGTKKWARPKLSEDVVDAIGRLSENAGRGIWRPDSLPHEAPARRKFFEKFDEVSLHVLGLQLSEDTVADVKGRVARSLPDAVRDLARNLHRLKKELEEIDKATPPLPKPGAPAAKPDGAAEKKTEAKKLSAQ